MAVARSADDRPDSTSAGTRMTASEPAATSCGRAVLMAALLLVRCRSRPWSGDSPVAGTVGTMAQTTNVIILAAGLGTRLQRPHPKPLTPLADGRSILRRQLDQFSAAFGDGLRTYIVVGFKLELVLEAAPDALFVYNEVYDQTNTCKSLLKALRLTPPEAGVLWVNGDVVFDAQVLERLAPVLSGGVTTVCVNTESVAEEEVKYTLDGEGWVRELSKTVVDGLGEAVGINYVAGRDKALLMDHLEACDDSDYFERGIEQAIAGEGLRVAVLDISDLDCVEVDFEADLQRARLL